MITVLSEASQRKRPRPRNVPETGPIPASAASVDVGAVVSAMASLEGGMGDHQSSIVDPRKLLDLDPSLDAR